MVTEEFMDHEPNPPKRADAKAAVACRLHLIRLELYGEHGGPVLAGKLRLPFRTWSNYELGVTMPGEVLLEFLELTGVEPLWLLRGIGEKYRVGDHLSQSSSMGGVSKESNGRPQSGLN